MRRLIVVFAIFAGVLVIGVTGSVVYTEKACWLPRDQNQAAISSILTTAERRDEVDTYLTYPEWSIVFAYDDLAAVARRSSESDFGYFGHVRQFWTSMCAVKRIASSRGEIPLTGAFTTVTAFGPQRGLLSAAATTDARIVSLGDRFAVLTGGASSFVWDLYKGGAWIVLPGDVTGCLRLSASGVR